MVATVAGTLAMTPTAAHAHNNSCHTQYLCPSDAHRYVWYGDAFGPYGSTYRGYDPYGYATYDPAAYYTGYNPYGYYGSDPYGYWGSYPGASGWGSYARGYGGYGGWDGDGAWGSRGWGYVGRKRDRRCDDLVARLQAQELDGQIERGRARVAHDPAALAEQRRHLALELSDVAPDAQRGSPAPQHGDDGVDLLVVVDAAGIFDAPSHFGQVTRPA